MHEFAAAGRSVVAEIDSLRANNTCLRIFTDNTHHQLRFIDDIDRVLYDRNDRVTDDGIDHVIYDNNDCINSASLL
ncbi:hypothetical protein [Oryza sativa Japonica Group]|uniref:Os01g0676701 protein n=1 Tax=Oryza sativa subsp. japonica TaxID=39947 RepID=Q8LQN8_ORYSJ|nr:hypothetical protein [Oryza sativa Japonica Group]BAD73455.1 hypothetical protein [Oryza sativa Japonica Group]BAH91232.1 Os01g0676701 [Oryza sativa Japonica Group]|eukprot:NP_001172502.1 Os01g0676701 [Oryza sativa Japonica Group]